jgi:P-type E1-E2 ATPase
VGSRALMLREKVSVALAERRITELEALGRTALLVALDGRLVGILALQDGLRPGARAAVQHLLDVDVEPVLLSGDSRETTEAVGRSIDIEHVRPELLASQRGEEVQKLSDGGAVVAVVGRSPIDDVALGAADVSVALSAPAATNAEWSVGLVTDDVRDAARAIRIAHRAKDDAKKLLAACLVPAGTAALAAAFGLLPAAVAPVAALAGTLGACLKSREE